MSDNSFVESEVTHTPHADGVDAGNVLSAALESEDAKNTYYSGVKIVGLFKKELPQGTIPMFRLRMGSNDKSREWDITAVPEEIARYEKELQKLENKTKK